MWFNSLLNKMLDNSPPVTSVTVSSNSQPLININFLELWLHDFHSFPHMLYFTRWVDINMITRAHWHIYNVAQEKYVGGQSSPNKTHTWHLKYATIDLHIQIFKIPTEFNNIKQKYSNLFLTMQSKSIIRALIIANVSMVLVKRFQCKTLVLVTFHWMSILGTVMKRKH